MAIIENVLYFDPSNPGIQRATMGGNGVFSATVGANGDSTVEFWFQTPLSAPSRSTDYVCIFDVGAEDGTNTSSSRMTLKLGNDKKLIWSLASVGARTSADVLGVSSLEMARWYHVALVIEAAGTRCSLYINGNLEGSVEKATGWLTWTTATKIMLGHQFGSFDRTSCLVGGAFSELRLWSVARTLGEIRSLLTTRATRGMSGLKGYYELKENSAFVQAAMYSSADMSSLRDPNVLLWRAGTAAAPENALASSCCSFGAFGATVDAQGNVTVEFWLRTPPGIHGTVLDVRNIGTSQMKLGFGSSCNLVWDLKSADGLTSANLAGPSALAPECWYHVAMVIEANGKKCSLYVNGSLENCSSNPTGFLTWSAIGYQAFFSLGVEGTGHNAMRGGYFSELRFWAAARTQYQIRSLMRTRAKVGSSGLTLYPLTGRSGSHGDQGTYRFVDMSSVWSLGSLHEQHRSMTAERDELQQQCRILTCSQWRESALHFDPTVTTTQHATIGGFSDAVGAGDSTVEFWLRTPPSPRSTSVTVLDVRGAGGARMDLTLGTDDRLIWTLVNADGTRTATMSSTEMLGSERWYHVALVILGGGTRWMLHVNGNMQSYSQMYSRADYSWLTWATDTKVTLGNRADATDNRNALLGGYLSEVRLWKREFQPQFMAVRATAHTAGLTLYPLTADDPTRVTVSGARYADVSMSELRSATAMLSRLGKTISDQTTLSSGAVVEDALYFDPAVTQEQSADMRSWSRVVGASGDSTIELWLRTPPASARVRDVFVFDIDDSSRSSQRRMHVALLADNRIRWALSGSTTVNVVSVDALEAQRWYHVALVLEGGGTTCSLYINGMLQRRVSSVAIWGSWTTSGRMKLGNSYDVRQNGQAFLGGYLAELRFWNVARTEEQIRALMTRRAEAGTSGLTALFPLAADTSDWTLNNVKYSPIDMSDVRSASAMLGRVGSEVSDRLNATAKVLPLLGLTSSTDPLSRLVDALSTSLDTARGTLATLSGVTATATDTVPTLVTTLGTKLDDAKKLVLPLVGLTSSSKTLLTLVNEDVKARIEGLKSEKTTLEAALSTATRGALSLLGLSTTTKTLPNLINEDVKTKIDGLTTDKTSLQTTIEARDGTILDVRNKVLPLLGLTSSTDPLSRLVDALSLNLATARSTLVTLLDLTASSKTLSSLVQEDLKPKFEALSTNLGRVKERLLSLLNLARSDKAPAALLEDYQVKVDGECNGLRRDNNALNDSLQKKGLQIQGLNTLVSDLTAKVNTANAEIGKLEGRLVDIEEKEQTITRLKSEMSEMETERKETSLENFVKNANDQITRARESLVSKGGKYALGRVSLDLKMYPLPSGVGIKFPSLEELKGLADAKLSTISVDFEAQDTTKAEATSVRVPAVLGYTEVMARRKIVEAGLLVEVSYQAVVEVPGRTIEADRVVNQVPRPGDEALLGSYVTIFLGRKC